MKFCLLIVFLSYSGISSQHSTGDLNSENNRAKRQVDKWNLGYVVPDTTLANLPTTTIASLKFQDSANPCLNKTYEPKPDFYALGKRVSITKCYEYIWEVKHRDEVDKRATECVRYRIKHPRPSEPHFAIGGRSTLPGEFPHMGAIGWQASTGTWIFKCGSSLISPKFVLTAAHCSSGSSRDTTIADPIPKIVRLGDKNILDKDRIFLNDQKIIKIITHPNYQPPKKYFDIALMELENEVIFTRFVQPACLWSGFDTSTLGDKATLTGWGVVNAGR